MAKLGKIRLTEPGPYLAMAILCEKVLTESDNVISAIRVIDNLTIGEAPDIGARFVPGIQLLTMFKSGGNLGDYPLRIDVTYPTSIRKTIISQTLTFSNPSLDSGTYMTGAIPIRWNGEGYYLYDVYLNDKFCTRVPLQILVEKNTEPPPTKVAGTRKKKK